MLAAEVSAAAEDDERDEEDGIGDIVRPGVNPDKLLGVLAKGEDGHEWEGHQELHGQHQEDLVKKEEFGISQKVKKESQLNNTFSAWEQYLSDERLSDGLILKAGVCEIIIVIVRWRPINIVTWASSMAWITMVNMVKQKIKNTIEDLG